MLKAQSRCRVLNEIGASLAGRVAEAMVFSDDAVTTCIERDLANATEHMVQCIRHWGFGERLSRTEGSANADENLNAAFWRQTND